MSRPLFRSALLFCALIAPGRAQAQHDSSVAQGASRATAGAYLAGVRRLTTLRVLADGERFEGILDSCATDRFTLSRWEYMTASYRELRPFVRIPFARVDTIWTVRGDMATSVARGFTYGALAGLAAGFIARDRMCFVDRCTPFMYITASTLGGAAVGGAVGAIVGVAVRGWRVSYARQSVAMGTP